MQEEEPRKLAPDLDVPDRGREMLTLRTAHHEAGPAVVLVGIEDIETDAGRLLHAERHHAEVVGSLIGPAALAVIVDFVPERDVRFFGEVDENEILLVRRVIAVDRIGQRQRPLSSNRRPRRSR